MLDIEKAEKSLSLLADRIAGVPLGLKLIERNGKDDPVIDVESNDINGMVGLPMFDSLRITSNNVKHQEDSEKYWFSLSYRYTVRSGGGNGIDFFNANLNPDGSIKCFSRSGNEMIYAGSRQFRKIMTSKDMINEFFKLLDSPFMREYETGLFKLLEDPCFYIDCTDGSGQTGMHFAARKGYDFILEPLIKYGANVNSLNGNDETPLFEAMRSGKIDTIKLLLDNGANFVVSADGVTAIDLVKKTRSNIDPNKKESVDYVNQLESLIEEHMLNKNIRTDDSEQSAKLGF